eukprot:XP_016858106.1 matrix metalloproteinase-23 isoform X2 [Homo sapiens]
MGRGARVPSEAPGAGVERRWLGAALVALCLLPALVLLARLGAPAVPAWSAAQVSGGGEARCRVGGVLTSVGLVYRGARRTCAGCAGCLRVRMCVPRSEGWTPLCPVVGRGGRPRPAVQPLPLHWAAFPGTCNRALRLGDPKPQADRTRHARSQPWAPPPPFPSSPFSAAVFGPGDRHRCLPRTLSSLKGDVAALGLSAVPPTRVPGPLAPRRRRYTLTPARLRWDHFNLTYRILSFPRNLLSPRETRRALAAAFRMWSDVSPFSFREVAPEQPSDLRIGFYPINHTDCLVSALHHCFDGPTGELAHAFFPPHGGIHFDDSEYWVLGPTRYSWKKGVWLTDLVHVAAHEIGHALGLMHSQHGRALMHLNATLRGWKALSQDELWGLHRLYGCLDRLFVCASWARRGFCDARRRLMKRLCPSSCDFCYEFPFPTVATTPPPPRTKTRLVPEGRNVTFRCGQKILHKKGKV